MAAEVCDTDVPRRGQAQVGQVASATSAGNGLGKIGSGL